MKIFHVLFGASCAAILACASAGTALALEDVPIVVEAIGSDDLAKLRAGDVSELLYFVPALSVFGGGSYAPEIGGGIKLRGIGDRRLSLSIEGSAALYQPGSVDELWIGSRVGFTLDNLRNVEIVGSGSVGLIGGTPSYRFGVGGELALLPYTDLFVEGVLGGHFGYSPTDNGIRAGLHFYPGRFGSDMLRGPEGTLYGQNTKFYGGGSVTVIPSASAAIPAVDFGATFGLANGLDLGARFSLGWQVPVGDFEAWGGGELGYQLGPNVRGYGFGEVGTIGGLFTANRIGVGGEYQFDTSISLIGEVSARGGIGSFSEFGLKTGFRYAFGEAPPPP